jgi:uronate dehydrogenase
VPTILMTGAAGLIGTTLRTRLAQPGRTLRLLDVAPVTAGPGEEAIQASVTDLEAMTAACQGVDAVIHLGGYSGEEEWGAILEVNINGGYVAFEAARRAGVSRVIYASSNHAVGFAPRASFPVPDYAFPEPDTYYGVSKVATEALASMYHHRYGLDAICVRILTCFERPETARALSTWLSPDDAGRLFEACLSAPRPGFRVIFGVSANSRGGWV